MFEFAECKPWLTVTPSRSVIKKGNQKIQFKIRAIRALPKTTIDIQFTATFSKCI